MSYIKHKVRVFCHSKGSIFTSLNHRGNFLISCLMCGSIVFYCNISCIIYRFLFTVLSSSSDIGSDLSRRHTCRSFLLGKKSHVTCETPRFSECAERRTQRKLIMTISILLILPGVFGFVKPKSSKNAWPRCTSFIVYKLFLQ